jgi:hypothetical protein
MAVSARDRRHFAVIAEAMAAEKDEQRAQALSTTAAERIAVGFVLGAVPRHDATEEALDERALGQIGLARRRLALRP